MFCLVSPRISSFTRAWFDQWLQVAFTKNAKGCNSWTIWERALGIGGKPWKLSVRSAKKKKRHSSSAFQVTIFGSGGNVCLASATKLCQWPCKSYYCWPDRHRKYKYLKFQRLQVMKWDLWDSAAACDVSEQSSSVCYWGFVCCNVCFLLLHSQSPLPATAVETVQV